MISEKQFEELTRKLDTLIKLTAYNSLKGFKTKTQKIGILLGLGFSTKDIALIVDTTEGSVETIKKRLRKRATKQRKTKGKGGAKSVDDK